MITRGFILVIFLLFLFIQSVSAQSVKIVKILDSNLFELEDGRKVKLAGIDSPQLNNPIPLFAETANYAVAYYKSTLLRRSVILQTISKVNNKNYELVYLWLEYPLEDLDFNQRILERGFGKFINNVDSTKTDVLIEAEKYAAANNEGIWKYYIPNFSDTLDGDLHDVNTVQLIKIDSTRIKKNFGPRPIYVSMPAEILAGSISTIIASLASGLLYSAVVHEHGEFAGLGAALFGIAVGYVFGFPSGVYLVASHDNPNLSYLATLGSSLVMTILSSAIASTYTGKERNHFTYYIAGFSPIIGSLLYVHAFPPSPPTTEDLIKQNLEYKKIESFKDYYDSKISFRMELMRIYF